MTRTAITLFSGFGLADSGLKAAGYTIVRAVEYDAAIAGVYAANHGDHIITADVRDLAFDGWRADHLHASPPCPNFSVAKSGGEETPEDTAMAEAVCRALRAIRPRTFTLENVRGYANSDSIKHIGQTLMELDYCVEQYVLNSADFGVPQTRERLFLRARAGGFMQSLPPLPPKQAWHGWYEAIEDLLPTLPESQFAPWQLKRLPEELKESAMLWNMDQTMRETTIRTKDQPVPTVDTGMMRRPSSIPVAFIVDGKLNDRNTSLTTRDGHERFMTVTTSHNNRDVKAWLVESKNANQQYGDGMRRDDEPDTTVVTDGKPSHQSRAWLSQGRVVAMTPRALARFMGVPDGYTLPSKQSLACKGLGNGVCPPVMTALVEGL